MADSIRDALTSAYKAADKDEDALASPAAIGSDEPGDAAPIGGDDTVSNAGVDDSPESAPNSDDEAPAPIAAPVESLNAPASWTKEERLEWAKTPLRAQKAALRREGEMQRAFQSGAQARKRTEALDKVTSDFKPLLDHYGVTLEQVMPPLLATRAALETGTPGQKAELVANICADFGIDIETLDQALSAKYANGAPAPRQQPPRPIDYSQIPELAPVFGLLAQIDAAKQQQAREVLLPLMQQPHYEAVRFTMADIIDRARNDGRAIDPSSAYDLACRFHGFGGSPGPQPTVSQAAAILAKSRKAASSVSGSPQPTSPRKPGEGSVADEVTALMSGRR